MYKTLTLIAALFCITAIKTFSQSCPPNIDFEKGDFSHWHCTAGHVSAVNKQYNWGLHDTVPLNNKHTILAAKDNAGVKDKYGHFPVVCPYGGNYSAKLGDETAGGQSEGLYYAFKVPANVDTFTFTYFYAVVFFNPNHETYEQPRFNVSAYDSASGQVISCASYDYVSTSGLPGFLKSDVGTDIIYKNWSPASIQFSGLQGHTIILEFKNGDCVFTQHFAYSYLDVGTGCSNILATAPFCPETNSLILNAPYGFKTYTWYNSDYSKVIGNQQSITFSPAPVTSGVYHVDIVPYPGYGCRDTADAVVEALPVPGMPLVNTVRYCQGDKPVMLTAGYDRGNDLLWYTSPSGGIGNADPPVPKTSITGITTYYVSQKKLFGCESIRTPLDVNVIIVPSVNFAVNKSRQCLNGNNFLFSNNTAKTSKPEYTWQFGDGETTNDTNGVHTYAKYGNYTVQLTVLNDSFCSRSLQAQVSVVPAPIARFNYPANICQNQTQVQLTDISSVPSAAAVINKWWWLINDSIVTSQALKFIPAKGGDIVIKQVVTTEEGCVSDTNNTTMQVHYQPAAAFSTSGLACDNEIVSFADKSTLPVQAIGETLSKWYWQFNAITDSRQNPSLTLPADNYKINLIAETNFGCISLPADSSFTVHAKPAIRLQLNDSCVVVRIQLQGLDLLNTVDKWYWDFGSGFAEKPSTLIRYYSSAGSYPFTLIGKTIYSCADTLTKNFVIYDNKSHTGNDTLAAMGQAVQLNANGGPNNTYTWQPTTGLNNANIENPVATLDFDQQYRMYSVSDKGCKASGKIFIKRVKGPEIYIPTAFTPNNDNLNDVLMVTPVGIKEFSFFSIYNRWGEEVFRTTSYSKGWDGNIKGTKAEAGTYIAVARAIDYRGNVMLRKTTVVLIR